MRAYEILKKHTNLNNEQLISFDKFTDMLLERNKVMNLTAITDYEEIAIKHYLDSLSILDVMNPSSGDRIIDIGTGAGFPSIPILIARSDLNITMLDSLNKRLVFINEVLKSLNLNGTTIHGRAEQFGHDIDFRECFDYAVSRAVARLNVLGEYMLPYVKIGGSVFAMKGPNVTEEASEAESGIKKLGGKIERIHTFTLPDSSKRSIIQIKKVAVTPKAYPRQGVKITKNPL